jgi:hypothetical protein
LQVLFLDGLFATSVIQRFDSTTSRYVVPVEEYSTTSAGGAFQESEQGMNNGLIKRFEDQELAGCRSKRVQPAVSRKTYASDSMGPPTR